MALVQRAAGKATQIKMRKRSILLETVELSFSYNFLRRGSTDRNDSQEPFGANMGSVCSFEMPEHQ
ncbi:uncharacterized protein N7518_010007 [Penicillium psychrosexuale]|uniref:uncharacterized protein n=1 Tax=Penicillium psychrosexuale TaxID=1002107 RepID=UPI002544E0B5|nr:uncharacterized protein N7518_010007 [Penicillium psychrosexuale]KAJ5781524.1 hypothetical protein N7518_010007 [Penicillium psychrosexuale]